MMKKKKNRFWLFVFSLWPGAGHMYMSFMKMGLSLTMGFLLMIGVVGLTNIGVLAVFPITLYIYSFFHANNLGGLDDEQFAAVEDTYLFGLDGLDFKGFRLERKYRNILAVVLIFLGLSMLWDIGFGMLRDYVGWDNPVMKAIYYFMRDDVPRMVIAVAIIWFGVMLLRGKKTDDTAEEVRRIERIVDAEPVEPAESWQQPEQYSQAESQQQPEQYREPEGSQLTEGGE